MRASLVDELLDEAHVCLHSGGVRDATSPMWERASSGTPTGLMDARAAREREFQRRKAARKGMQRVSEGRLEVHTGDGVRRWFLRQPRTPELPCARPPCFAGFSKSSRPESEACRLARKASSPRLCRRPGCRAARGAGAGFAGFMTRASDAGATSTSRECSSSFGTGSGAFGADGCGVVVELVPWAAPGSWFTTEFEDMTAYLAQHSAKTVVASMMGVAWATVGAIIQRVVARRGPRDLLDGLTHIGVDELSYRRHHEYITVVVDHGTGRVVWAARGKNADTLRAFFAELGPERCGELEAVTIDMSAAYIAAVTEASPKAKVIFDKFHVQRLAHDALDQVRRSEVRESRDPEVKRALKHSRFALQKNPWNLNDIEHQKVSEVQRTNRALYRAYLLKESLAAILARRQPNVARRKLLEWADWGTRSQLAPFARAAKTVRRHLEGIVAYIASGLTNARSEGMNGKARAITRRSYGFHSASSLIAMLFLCCTGMVLSPVIKIPRFH
jgi:transposase